MLKQPTSTRIRSGRHMPLFGIEHALTLTNPVEHPQTPATRKADQSTRAALKTAVIDILSGGILWPGTIWIAALLVLVK